MMSSIIIYSIAFFFTISWSIIILMKSSERVIGTVVTTIYWWIILVSSFFYGYNKLHIIWLMLTALILPMIIMLLQLSYSRPGFISNLLLSGAIILPLLYVVSAQTL